MSSPHGALAHNAPLLEQALHTLQHVFGYRQFRGEQAQIVMHLASGGEALVLMPTGGGKSMCYQLPALLMPGCAIIVSPLIALMQDQVAALQQNGVAAALLNSTLDGQEAWAVEQQLLRGQLKLLYVAPERLNTPRFLELLDRMVAQQRINLFAIDEAHCVSAWGHDFRPEYRELSLLHERYPHIPRVALTATADAQTRADIIEHLALQGARVFISSFDRPNIRYTIAEKQQARQQLLQFIQTHHAGQSGIVYCGSRSKTEDLVAWLNAHHVPALPYHAGLDADVRAKHQTRFANAPALVMCATIAFGMGIDKPDVRFVAHVDMPKSIEAYYQETGRAGRDGEPANAWMVYGLQDVVQQRKMIDQSPAQDEYKQVSIQKLDALLGLAQTASCRRVSLLAYFGQNSTPCGNCDNCLHPPRMVDSTVNAQKMLSAIYRTGQRFGAGHVMDVLRGRETDRTLALGHNQLPTFGVGKDQSEQYWRLLLRQLIVSGHVWTDSTQFNVFKLNESARAVLKGELQVWLRQDLQQQPDQPSWRKSKASVSGNTPAIDPESALLRALKAWRLQTARELAVPAFVVFNDATLHAIVHSEPLTRSELRGINGIGDTKLESYGEDVLRIVKEHVH